MNNLQKDKSGILLIAIGGLLMIAALFYYFNDGMPQSNASGVTPKAPVEQSVAAPSAMGHENALEKVTKIDAKQALSARTLGNDDAPVKIYEYASLTCGHCAHFHKTTFKDIKSQYIDTGKVQIIFSDFPLNEPALKGSMAARCLPKDQYANFVQTLLEEQEEWAFTENYLSDLEQYAKRYGMDSDTFYACVNNNEIQQGLIANMQASARQWQVNSTPSFLINNVTLLTGAKTIAEFAAEIDKQLAK